jgi:hypothetical protein
MSKGNNDEESGLLDENQLLDDWSHIYKKAEL